MKETNSKTESVTLCPERNYDSKFRRLIRHRNTKIQTLRRERAGDGRGRRSFSVIQRVQEHVLTHLFINYTSHDTLNVFHFLYICKKSFKKYKYPFQSSMIHRITKIPAGRFGYAPTPPAALVLVTRE